jgi:hypothetical protein
VSILEMEMLLVSMLDVELGDASVDLDVELDVESSVELSVE